jgi:urea transport system substrate-binding protein
MERRQERAKRWRFAGLGLLLLLALLIHGLLPSRSHAPIRVGVLHSLSGTMAISEKSVADATLLAIEELNESGGLLGRSVEPVLVDGRSHWPTFAAEAERLITEERVSVVFGCWTSASRKTVKPVFEQHDHLLFYPVQYEGLEQSPNIVYTGAAPNQQIIPAVKWCFDKLGRRFFLVGSDYVFPRTANAVIRDQVTALRGEIVGEAYVPLGAQDMTEIVAKIADAQPDVILNTINGDSNVAFFEALHVAGISPTSSPTMSFSLAEDELRALGTKGMVGHYACWNYMQSIDSADNRRFVAAFKDKYGPERVTDDPMEAAYFGVKLWAQAVVKAGDDRVQAVRAAIGDQSYAAPEGVVYIDHHTQPTWKTVRIGRIRADGQFDVVWSSKSPVRPMPYPAYRTREEWDQLLQELYAGWGGRWASPAAEGAQQP